MALYYPPPAALGAFAHVRVVLPAAAVIVRASKRKKRGLTGKARREMDDTDGGGLTLGDVGALRVVDLKEALKERELPTDGKKVRKRPAVAAPCCHCGPYVDRVY